MDYKKRNEACERSADSATRIDNELIKGDCLEALRLLVDAAEALGACKIYDEETGNELQPTNMWDATGKETGERQSMSQMNDNQLNIQFDMILGNCDISKKQFKKA